MNDKNRILYLDILRILACLAVIGIHVASSVFYGAEVTSRDFKISALWLSFFHWSVPVFVMISGMHFLDPALEIDTGKLYRKNILRILLVFLLWTVVYALMGIGSYHLWFLLMLAGLYVITPLLRKITADEKALRYFLAVSFVYFAAVFLKDLAGALVIHQRREAIIRIYEVLNTDFEYVNWQFPAGYAVFYVLGAYLGRYDPGRKIKTAVYALMFPAALGSWYVTVLASELKEGAFPFYQEGSLPMAIIAAGVFLAVKDLSGCGKRNGASKAAGSLQAVAYLSKCTLGIYVTHLCVFTFLEPYICGRMAAAAYIPIAIAAVFVLSLAVTALLRLIPGFNRIFI